MTRRLSVLVGVTAVVFLVAFWFVGWAPATKNLHAARGKVTAADSQMQQLQSQVASLLAAEKRAPIYKVELNKLDQAVPDDPDYASVIDDFTNTATASKVTISNITPSVETPIAGTATAASGPTKLGLSLSVTGTYSEILSFITDLEQQPRIFVISGINLSGGGATALSATISCAVFYANASAAPGSGDTQ